MNNFYGRAEELKILEQLLQKKVASLVVVKGRRRIGKSRLILEFARRNKIKTYNFSGLPPLKTITPQNQKEEFVLQMARQGIIGVKPQDWGDIFWQLNMHVNQGRVLILLDEISWLGGDDSTFLGKLKNSWDQHFKNNPKLTLVLCGSVSAWIEENIMSNTGFLGRISLNITLNELPLEDCDNFWRNYKDKTAAYEKFKILGITGGVPRYLEELNPKISAEENIRQQCFSKEGLLFNEFDHIFFHIFSSRSLIYKKIITALAEGMADQNEICSRISLLKNRSTSEYFSDLEKSGFIQRDYAWDLKTGKISKLSKYRLKDNYLRFYLKYLLPNKLKIEQDLFRNRGLTSLPAWDTIMGLQFENLILSNRKAIYQKLTISPEEIVFTNPFFQRKTNRIQGCQIDFLIQTKYNCLYICEIKFSKNKLPATIIDEVKNKIERLSMPRHFSYRPVLIHVNGVHPSVEDADYFSNVIDFRDLF